jgi:hypothetical protein
LRHVVLLLSGVIFVLLESGVISLLLPDMSLRNMCAKSLASAEGEKIPFRNNDVFKLRMLRD